MRPKVSIIVPVYGTAWSLRECLDSLIGQSLRDSEIIVVNDASPDDAADIIDEYAQRDSRIRVITNAVNLNLFESRLRGFEAAEGECVATCDSDDAMPPGALECLYAAAVQEKADIVHGKARELGGKRPGAVLYNCEPFQVTTGRMFVASIFGTIRGWNVWGKLFRRGLVRTCIGGFPRNTGWFQAEDMVYCTLLGLAAERYAGIEDTVYAYRYSDLQDNQDDVLRDKKIYDQIRILTFLGRVIKNEPCFHDLEQSFNVMANHVMTSILRIVPMESRKLFSEDIAQIGLESVKHSSLLSWRYHSNWIRKNGIEEYILRIRILLTNAYRIGWIRALKRVLNVEF